MCIRFECGYYLVSVAHKRWEITRKDIQRENWCYLWNRLAYFRRDAAVIVRRILRPLARSYSGAVARTLVCQKEWIYLCNREKRLREISLGHSALPIDLSRFFKKIPDILHICKDVKICVRIIQSPGGDCHATQRAPH
jgi:hypothetical protein